MKEGRAEAGNYQNKGDNNNAFYNHGETVAEWKNCCILGHSLVYANNK